MQAVPMVTNYGGQTVQMFPAAGMLQVVQAGAQVVQVGNQKFILPTGTRLVQTSAGPQMIQTVPTTVSLGLDKVRASHSPNRQWRILAQFGEVVLRQH